MVWNHKPTGKAASIPGGLALGGIISFAITLAGAAALAWLVHRERIAEENVGYGIMIVLLAASFAGAITAHKKIKRRRALICMMSGGTYLLTLLAMTALFFGGQYSGVGETALMVFCGAALGILPGLQKNSRGGKRKIRIPAR